jgi:ribonucleoside-diphosphate reductase alpha chain
MTDAFPNPLAELVWRTRYRGSLSGGATEQGPSATTARVARALALREVDAALWRERFAGILDGFRFLPGGRILASAGTSASQTWLNCFVMGRLEDAPVRLFRALGEGARTLRLGGGVGWDFSTLAPRGSPLGRGAVAPGPVACLELCDVACRTVTAGSARGGAMMASLAADHPDILEFISAKARGGVLERFNLSVQVSDALMAAVGADASWALSPGAAGKAGRQLTVPARTLWLRMLESMVEWSEPGVLFTDTINRENNLWWRERLTTTNPCGETPLPAYGACDLGSINLAALVQEPFTRSARVDSAALDHLAATAVRLLDNGLDASSYPLARQRREALSTRRIGLGVTGLGDALAMLGLRYDSEQGRTAAADLMERIKLAAYAASVGLAEEKGRFPGWDRDRYLSGAFVSRLPGALRDRIAAAGIRNSHLLAIAPTGSISLLAGNVSPGIEPIPALEQRRLVAAAGEEREFEVADRAWSLFRESGRTRAAGAFVVAADVSPGAQLEMQAALQRHVDGAISKTVLLPPESDTASLGGLLHQAHRAGLKGFAVHRPGSRRGSVIGPSCTTGLRGRAECEPV